MRDSTLILFRTSCAFLMALACLSVAWARERGPRVEVSCPAPPIPVVIDKKRVLVYEFHVTNFDSVPLTLKRVEIFGGDNSNAISVLTEDALSAAMTAVGGQSKDARVIGPGQRSVVFLWIELPANSEVPSSLRHRMVFSSTGTGDAKPADSILENFPVAVSRDPVPVLSSPFGGGIWVAGDAPSNTSPHRRSIFAIDGHLYSPERFAIDWVKVGPNGDSRHEGSTRNENWWGFGERVLAVADGEVSEVVDGIADNVPRNLPPVTLDNILGNHVILKIAPDRFVTYAHLQSGSIRVKTHDRVSRGSVLGLLGNSGNTTGAHLHMQMTDGNSALQSQGVPFMLEGFTYLGPGSDYEADKHLSEHWGRSIPPDGAVIDLNPAK